MDAKVEGLNLSWQEEGQGGFYEVYEITPGSPAVGLLFPGDVVRAINGQSYTTKKEADAAFAASKGSKTVKLAISRPQAAPPANPALRRPYVPLHALQRLWLDEVAPRVIPDEPSCESILADALSLLANQGDIFVSGGLVFLDPAFATELLKPIVDHRLSREREAPNVEEHVRATLGATQGARASRSAVEQLLRGIDSLKSKGMLREPLLPFLWRSTALPSGFFAFSCFHILRLAFARTPRAPRTRRARAPRTPHPPGPRPRGGDARILHFFVSLLSTFLSCSALKFIEPRVDIRRRDQYNAAGAAVREKAINERKSKSAAQTYTVYKNAKP